LLSLMQKNEENGHGNPRLNRKKRINNLSIKKIIHYNFIVEL
jgi:hypothetical protein